MVQEPIEMQDVEWLLKDLYGKIGLLLQRINTLERENDQLIEHIDMMSIELEDLEKYVLGE